MFGVIAAVILLTACSGSGYVPVAGDLLFQVAGGSEFSAAIADATASADSLKFAHVAIVAIDDDGLPYVVEASGRDGVVRTTWDDFLSQSPKVNGRPGVVIMRVTGEFSASEAIARAESHLGEEYDWWYTPDNGKMYCSELVYESFLTADGSHLFTARPMNFRSADGSMPAFWEQLFAELGEPVPEGLPGTNPNDMSKDPVLTEICRMF